MTIPKFSEFAGNPADTPAVTPDAETPAVDPAATDLSQIPALFATIHHKSDERPDGYTSDDIADLNDKANAHLKKDDTPAA